MRQRAARLLRVLYRETSPRLRVCGDFARKPVLLSVLQPSQASQPAAGPASQRQQEGNQPAAGRTRQL